MNKTDLMWDSIRKARLQLEEVHMIRREDQAKTIITKLEAARHHIQNAFEELGEALAEGSLR